jgi:hypothetical protein
MRKIGGLVALASAVALLAAPAQLRAQDPVDPTLQGPSRVALEGFLAHYLFDGFGGDRVGIGGVGIRAMVGRGAVPGALTTFFNRARAGIFVVYTADQDDNNVSTFHYGAQAEVPLFPAPVARGFLDPFVSLSAGLFRASADAPEGSGAEDVSSTDFALSPGVGTMIPLFGAVAIRGDIRDVIVFGDPDTSNNFVFEGGISIGF